MRPTLGVLAQLTTFSEGPTTKELLLEVLERELDVAKEEHTLTGGGLPRERVGVADRLTSVVAAAERSVPSPLGSAAAGTL